MIKKLATRLWFMVILVGLLSTSHTARPIRIAKAKTFRNRSHHTGNNDVPATRQVVIQTQSTVVRLEKWNEMRRKFPSTLPLHYSVNGVGCSSALACEID
ncbi:MAG: hypothetical protein R3E08_10915 [Thiotrichaceae bacterium]